MIRKTIFVLLIFETVSLFSCFKQNEKEISRGVYFWKTTFNLSPSEINWLKETAIKKLYIRFFDVDWNPGLSSAVPVGDVAIESKNINNVDIIPVVFITNRTLLNISDSAISRLSFNIHDKICSKFRNFTNQTLKEIQLDCDWTETTRDKYFSLIEQIKKLSLSEHVEITATIRLHQVKYYRMTGVPPIKRGTLMFYNMTDVSDIKTRNSIFDIDAAKKYLLNVEEYPIDLDVVLPAFSWACWFRNEKLKNLINDIKAKDLRSNNNFIQEDKYIFRALKEYSLKGNYILKGDYIRTEETGFTTTYNAAELIAPYIKNKRINVSIYHLNNEIIKNYGPDKFKDIVDCFN